MKRIIALAALLSLVFCSFAFAEKMAEYSDNMFSFKYPASWKQYTNTKGDIVVEPQDGKNAILAFAFISNIYRFTEDADTAAPTVERFLSEYGGQNFEPSGEYAFITRNGMKGFRAPEAGGQTGRTR